MILSCSGRFLGGIRGELEGRCGGGVLFCGLDCTSEEGDIGQDRIPDARGMWHRFGQGFVRRGESRAPEGEDIGPGKDSVG